MYRAVTWAVLRAGVDPHDAEAVAKVAGEVDLRSAPTRRIRTCASTASTSTREIRGPEVTGSGLRGGRRAGGTPAAGGPAARDHRRRARRIVVEGRDIGTRGGAGRRPEGVPDRLGGGAGRAGAAPRTPPTWRATAADLARRDRLDSTRAADPLAQAPDAVVLDTTGTRHRRGRRAAARHADSKASP